MFIRRRKNKSGSTTVVADKNNGQFTELYKIDTSKEESEILELVSQGKNWIRVKELSIQPELDLYGEEHEAKSKERVTVENILSNIDNILINGTELILNRVFDRIGFNQIKDEILRKLVLSRLSYPASKAATVEYLKNHFDEDVDLSRIYRYLDKLGNKQHNDVQRISVEHTRKLLGGSIGVMFYDVTTLYFETDREDDLRKTRFSKEGDTVIHKSYLAFWSVWMASMPSPGYNCCCCPVRVPGISLTASGTGLRKSSSFRGNSWSGW